MPKDCPECYGKPGYPEKPTGKVATKGKGGRKTMKRGAKRAPPSFAKAVAKS